MKLNYQVRHINYYKSWMDDFTEFVINGKNRRVNGYNYYFTNNHPDITRPPNDCGQKKHPNKPR